jgi:hypothetical protein
MSSSKNMKEIDSEGISIPNWMKNKRIDPQKRSDDLSTFSPPSHDDSFFFIRYPLSGAETSKSNNTRSITEVFADTTDINTLSQQSVITSTKQWKLIDSKDYVNKEPKGIDDGFIGAGGGICGKSLVKVAEKLVASKLQSGMQGLNLSHFQGEDIEPSEVPHINERRGSRSLPVSPLHSPKLQRRFHQNPYFTVTAQQSDTAQRYGFLSTLFNIGGSASTSTHSLNNDVTIEEGTREAMDQHKIAAREAELKEAVVIAQPSNLRELNFWAPTSM